MTGDGEHRIDVYVQRSDAEEAAAEIEAHLEQVGILARVEY